jgi:hypothetical protein
LLSSGMRSRVFRELCTDNTEDFVVSEIRVEET